MKRKFFCYALNDFCGRDTFCNECEVYDGTGGECRDTEQTNADHIRSMTDEELAEWMSECNAYGERAMASQWMPWLKQPYEVEV